MKKIKINSWIKSFVMNQIPNKAQEHEGFVVVMGEPDQEAMQKLFRHHALDWQRSLLEKSEKEVLFFQGKRGPIWIVVCKGIKDQGHEGLLNDSIYSWTRDTVGGLLPAFKAQHLKAVHIDFHSTTYDHEVGALVGLEIASYNFKQVFTQKFEKLPQVYVTKAHGDLPVDEALHIASSVNLTRHFVNLPPNEVNPTTFSKWVRENLKFPKSVKVSVWDQARLKRENMNLHLAVGQGSSTPPCLVHIRYRPTKKTKRAPIAFVGKGITFDTGGLDIKPSSGMRLMKKDMGGAAAVVGLAHWAAVSQYPAPLDFYLALAENSVDGHSFRPSDVVEARSGMSVEIDNTDAEGRLVLADALDVAVTQPKADMPEMVIDIATLTGAIKVGLGSEIAGLFANDDSLAMSLTRAGQNAGELNWRMPLYEKYWSSMSSHFADCKNSGDGFGGAITAALFLQKFVRGTKWAHLDIYAWSDKGHGALLTTGASGQPVQCLIKFLLDQLD